MATWQIILEVEDGEIKTVTGPDGPGTPFTLEDRKKFKKSHYGLRAVDTLYEHNSKSFTLEAAATTECFMVIGGFKVKVPCT